MFFEILRKYRNDIILIVCLLIISTSAWFIIDATKTEGGTVVVMKEGKEYARYPLNRDAEIVIKNGKGHNLLVIKDGSATIEEASCPDKLCVKQPDIAYNGETLVCLPNKITVKIISEIEPEADFVS